MPSWQPEDTLTCIITKPCWRPLAMHWGWSLNRGHLIAFDSVCWKVAISHETDGRKKNRKKARMKEQTEREREREKETTVGFCFAVCSKNSWPRGVFCSAICISCFGFVGFCLVGFGVLRLHMTVLFTFLIGTSFHGFCSAFNAIEPVFAVFCLFLFSSLFHPKSVCPAFFAILVFRLDLALHTQVQHHVWDWGENLGILE